MIPDSTDIALAARNEIVRLTGECTIPLIVIFRAIEAAERTRKKIKDSRRRKDPAYGQPWKAVQRMKGGMWSIVSSVGHIVAEGIDTHGQATFIVNKINESWDN